MDLSERLERETAEKGERDQEGSIDRDGWKSCVAFLQRLVARARVWGVQWAMRGCVSAHVGALSTPDCVRPLDRHVPDPSDVPTRQ